MRGKGGVRMVIEGYGDRVKKENAGERDVDKMVSSRPRSNSGPPGYFMSKLSYSNHNIRLCESFLTMYRSRGCRQGPDTSRRLLLC